MNPDPNLTYAACLTPPGRGAIATLAVDGPRAWEVARKLFRPATRLPEQPQAGRFWLGHFGDEIADEVVLAVRTISPRMRVEIHCHGGPEVIRLLLEALAAQDIPICSWQTFASLDAPSEWRAAAKVELAHAPTIRTASILLDQAQGAMDQALSAIRTALEEENQTKASPLLEGLARYANLGRHLTTPWRVAVIGPPNVGKSSLVNALAGFQRSVVAATPGTTRDVVTTLIAVDGWPIELADTAGLREEAGDLEEQGIARARQTANDADLCLWTMDAAAPPVWPDEPSDSLRYVINKIDQPAVWNLDQVSDAARVSARTGEGLAELCQRLAAWLVPEAPAPGAAVPFAPALGEMVHRLQALVRARQLREAALLLREVAYNAPS
jgi:tRNA modification GTPase